uniref:formylglycine-generating enzyme family protein n=1 Tax=uncultured Lamprocystis sp. TaxID=543132 RepID=UPI0025F0C57D
AHGISDRWSTLRDILAGQCRVTATFRRADGRILHVRKATRAEPAQLADDRSARRTLRLPTEAEWEYACRAGTTGPFSFGDDITPEQANYDGNYPYRGNRKGLYRQETIDVASLPPNPWGLYEMHGNVWEWCRDWYGEYPSGLVTDPVGPDSGVGRVLRGGGWLNDAQYLRSAYRNHDDPGYRRCNRGFRLALGPEPGQAGQSGPAGGEEVDVLRY